MSREIINLRRVRKSRDRASHAAAGAANRVRYGRSRLEREMLTRETEIADRRLDGHRREVDEMATGPNDGDSA